MSDIHYKLVAFQSKIQNFLFLVCLCCRWSVLQVATYDSFKLEYYEFFCVLWRCWLGGRKGIRPVKNWVVWCWHGCLGWGADLHIAQQMPLPLTISCSSYPDWFQPSWFYLSGTCSPGWSWTYSRRAVKRLCVCVCCDDQRTEFLTLCKQKHHSTLAAPGWK